MMKKKGILTAGICCLATALCGLFAVQNVENVSADVAPPTAVTNVENHFFMEVGAAVRKNADSVGIRYTAYVSEEWCELAEKEGEVKFYTDIDKDGNVDDGEAVTVEATEALVFTTTFESRENLYKFTGALTYTNLETSEWTDEQRTLAYNMQLEGQAYAVITHTDGSTQRIDAVQNDNVRSMGEVADLALKAEEAAGELSADTGELTATEENKIAGYRTTANATAYVDNTTYNTLDVGATYANANILKVKMADENDTYSESEGTFTFDNAVATATSASDAYATVYTDKGIIETNFKVCKGVIKTATDWSVFDEASDTKGYYYLANDIEDYPEVSVSKGGSTNNEFMGVFDGGGHTANFTLASQNGLFYSLNGAEIKNVRFNIRMKSTLGWKNIGIATLINGVNKFADMYLNIETLATSCNRFGAFAHDFLGNSDFTRVVIETPTMDEMSDTNKTNIATLGALAYRIQNINLTTGQTSGDQASRFYSDVYVISPLPLAREAGYSSTVKWTINAENKMTDTNGDKSITTADITYDSTDTTKNVTYWTTTTNKNGYKVYSYASFDELKTDAIAPDENTAAKIDLTTYTNTAYWTTDTNGYLTWVGKN